MPVVTPAGVYKEELTNIIKNTENVPMVFRGKKIETFVIPSSLSTFSVRLIQAEYRRIIKDIIPAFNVANNTDVDQLADADLPCASASPTANEINTGFRNLVLRINNSTDAPAIEVPADIPAPSSNDLRKHVNDVIRLINNTVVTKRHFVE